MPRLDVDYLNLPGHTGILSGCPRDVDTLRTSCGSFRRFEMFCPQCKAEYRVGFTRCSDCRVDLVDYLPAEEPTRAPKASTTFEADPFGPEPELVVIRTYQRGIDADLAKSVLEAAGIPSMIRGDDGR